MPLKSRNKKLRSWTLAVFVMFGIFACATKPPVKSMHTSDEELVKKFAKGNELMSAGKYAEAAKLFDDLMVDRPATEIDLVIIFNAAASYEALGNCREAGRRYRKVVRGSHKKYSNLEALALYRVGQMHVCVLNNDNALASYLDAWNRRENLPLSVSAAELPARLAMVYSILGNRKQSEKYFQIAQQGLLKVQSQRMAAEKKTQLLAKTLYFMGQMENLNFEVMDEKLYLTTVADLQSYLLKAVELGALPWTVQAATEINVAYENAWVLIGNIERKKSSQSELEKRESQKLQNWIAEEALGNIEKLKAARYPEDQNLRDVKALFAQIDEHQRRYKQYLSAGVLGNTLTESAKRREGLRRQGRVYRPDPILEEQAHRRIGLPKKTMTPIGTP